MKWSEHNIGRALAQQFFNRKYLVVVPNCNWTGYECDILAVTENLRIIDVEIKISRSDLKADAKKDKWLHYLSYAEAVAAGHNVSDYGSYEHRVRVEWPRKVWKHYYAMPADVWDDGLMDALGSPASGVLLLSDRDGQLRIHCQRPAKPCRDADRLNPAAAVAVARLASLRMWDAYKRLEDNCNFERGQNTSGSPAPMMDPCTQDMEVA